MNISAAFSFPFKDPNWVTKMIWLSIFLLLSPLLIGIPFFLGYTVLTTRNIIEGKEKLPEWSGNWSNIFYEGLKYLVAIIIISVFVFLITLIKIPGLNFLWYLLSIFLSTLLLARVAAVKKFEEIFDLKWYVEFMINNPGDVIIVTVLGLLLSVVAYAGLILCFVGVFLTLFYSLTARSYLIGEMYRVGEERMKGGTKKRRKKKEEVEIVNDVEE